MVQIAKTLVALAGAFGAVSAAAGDMQKQVVNGTVYLTTGPQQPAHWHDYWFTTSRTALHTLKALLGPDGLKELLKPEIEKGDVFWRDVVTRSTGATWKPAKGRTVAYLPDVDAQTFVRWFSSPLADEANTDANAEHYYKSTTADAATGSLSSEIIEGWGGVVTHFKIPTFAPANRERFPMIDALSEFPIQFAGEKVLLDGTVFGILHIAVRDVKAGEFPEYEPDGGAPGVEVYAAVWYGDASDDNHLEAERQHMIIEEINLTQQCQLDIESGRITRP